MAPVLPPLSTSQHHLPGAGEAAYTLCPFPTAASGTSAEQQVALFGGEDGILYVLPSANGSNTSTTSTSTEPRAVRTFDEGIRSLAVSSDGRRVAVGLESGETRIFAYDSPYGDDGNNNTTTNLHAFLNPANTNSASSGAGDDGMAGMDDDDDDDGFGGMMSQEGDAASSPTKSSSSASGGTSSAEFAGPRFDAPVRDLAFLPSSAAGTDGEKYYLAIATESPASFCIVDVATADTAAGQGGDRHLQTEAEASHDSGGVRGLAVGNGTVATLGLDGRLCVWRVPCAAGTDPTLDWEELHQDAHKAVPKADIGAFNGSDVADQVTHPAMVADGSWLAIPGRSDVQLRHSSEGYRKERFLCSKAAAADDGSGEDGGSIRGHSDVTVRLTFSPDGNHLLSSGRDGRIVVWKVSKEAPSAEDSEADATCGKFVCELPRASIAATMEATSATVVTSMTWSKDGTVRIARSDGSVTVIADIDGFIRSAKKAATEAVTSKEATAKEAATESTEDAGNDSKSRISKKGGLAESDSDDDIDFGGDDDKAATAKSSTKSNRFVDDEADEDDDDKVEGEDITKDDDANSAAAEKDQPPADEGGAGGLDDFVVDDDAVDGFPMADDDDDDGRDGGDLQPYSRRHGAAYDVPEMQPAFAPSSTPLSASTTRILCWNHIGTLTIRDDGPNNTVDINFVDGAFRRPVTFTDNLNFIVGSLGEDGGVFASDVADDDFDGADDMDDMVDGLNMSDATKRILKRSNRRKKKSGSDDAPKGSSIYFHRFETFGPIKDKDWVLTLPDGEMALGCACGEGWAAVATSRRFLRLYSSGGNQGPVTWLKGDLITMVGRGRFLGVFYHEGTPMPDGTQRIGYQLLDAASGNLVSTGSVSAISPSSTMTWAGFSNDYSLMVMDSDGMLSMLASETGINTTGGGWEWSPMLDTVGLRKSNDDSFWPVTCMDGKLVCVPLKGGNEHPDAVRRPVTTALGFRLPLARGALGKFSALEDIQVRADLSLKQKKFVNVSIAPDDEELMDEYDAMCAQVDKVTLKLFFDILKAGKVERALDLVERLHLEKSFEIAIKASDRLNYLKLSDRIEAARDARFPPEQFEEEEEEIDDGVDRRYFAQRPLNTDRQEDDRDVDEESVQSSTAITPDVNRRGGVKRNREDFHSDVEEEEEEEPDQRPAPTKRKINPFAKKKMESPGKGQLSSPLRSPSAKPKLSRNSTFSAQSRAKTKGQKRIL